MAFLKTFLICFFLTSNLWASVLGDFSTLVPNTDGLYFVSLHSGQTVKKGTWNANAYLSYAKNYLLVYDDLSTMRRLNYDDEFVEFDGTVGYTITDSMQLFLGFTSLLHQAPDTSEEIKVNVHTGLHSFRPGVKWNFYKNGDSYWALIPSVDIYTVEHNPYTGENPPATPNLELAWQGKTEGGKATHGVNVGVRARTPGSTPSDAAMYPLKNQFLASYGYSYPWKPATRLVFETIGCYPLTRSKNKKAEHESCLEFLGAIRHRLATEWALVGGATIEAPGMKTMSPDWRVFVGLNAYLYPSDSDKASGKRDENRNAQPLYVPSVIMMTPNDIMAIPISGGVPDYTCSMIDSQSSEGAVRDCKVYAPPHKDVFQVRVLDSSGQMRTTEIIVQEETAPLRIEPEQATVLTGQTVKFKARGGRAPYRFKVESGVGTVNSVSGVYRSSRVGSATVIVQDREGNSEQARVIVRALEKPDEVITLKNVNFIFDTTTLVKESQLHLAQTMAKLQTMKIRRLVVEGHTDDIGNDDYNQNLSERRAERIAELLGEALGLRADQITAIGWGEEKPLVPNRDSASRLQNRRVELKIFK